jgi:hypothetical protein
MTKYYVSKGVSFSTESSKHLCHRQCDLRRQQRRHTYTMGNVQEHVGRQGQIGRHTIEVVKYLGEGGSSFIFLVKDAVASSQTYVLKRLIANDSVGDSYRSIAFIIIFHFVFDIYMLAQYPILSRGKDGHGVNR